MSRKFMSFVLATALTVTSLSSAPAHAGNNDFAKALVGIAAVAMIAKAIEQENTTRRAAQAQPHHSHAYAKPQYHKPQYHKPQYHQHGHYRHKQAQTYGHVVAPRPLPHRVARANQAALCKQVTYGRNGRVLRETWAPCSSLR